MIVTTEVSSDVIFLQQWFEFRYKIWSVAMDTSWQDWVMTSYYEVFRSEIQIRQSCQKKKCIFRIAFVCTTELSFIVTTGDVTNVAQWKVLNIKFVSERFSISVCAEIKKGSLYQDGLFVNLLNLWRIPRRISMNYYYSRRLLECLFYPFELFLHIWQFLQIFLPG